MILIMFHPKKSTLNGVLQSSMRKMETSLSVNDGGGGRSRRRNSTLASTGFDCHNKDYSYSHRRPSYQQQSMEQHRRKRVINDEYTTRKLPRSYDRQIPMPEPDYSQSDTEDRGSSLRIRNPCFWANSSEYYHNTATEGRHKTTHSLKPSLIPELETRPGAPTDGMVLSTSLRKNTNHSNNRVWSTDNKQRSLPIRRTSRDISTNEHITMITLNDADERKVNGDPFGSSLRVNNGQQHHHPNYRANGEEGKKDIRGITTTTSQPVDTIIPSTFSNVNLLKRVNDRYKLTERLLIQLKIIAALYAFFGFAMFSLDSSQAIIVWPYVEDDRRLYLCLRVVYSIGVVVIGCFTITVACGKRTILLEIVKIVSIVFIAVLLAAPAQTPFFQNIADSLQYNDAIRRYRTFPLPNKDQYHRQRHFASHPDELDELTNVPNVDSSTEDPPTSANGHPKHRTRLRTTTNPPDSSEERSEEEDPTSKATTDPTKAQPVQDDSSQSHKSSTDERQRALRVAQHLRMAYIIFGCCHYLLTAATLIVVIRLERIS